MHPVTIGPSVVEKAMASEMTASEANTLATSLLRQEGKAVEALAILESTLESKASSLSAGAKSTLLANQGLCLEQLGRLDEAVARLEASVEASKGKNASAKDILRQLKASQLMARAVDKAAGNEFSTALAMFQEAGRLDPGDGTWRYNVAVMLNKLGNTRDSLEELRMYRRGLSVEGGGDDDDDDDDEGVCKVTYLPLLGELLCKEQQWTEAITVIDDAIEKNVELPASLLYNYGVALLRTGNSARARSAFDDVVAYYPNYGMAYDALASLDAQEGSKLCQEGKFSEAIPKLAKAVKRTPKTTTLYNLGLALLKERRAPEAKETFEHIVRMDASNKNAKHGLDAAELMLESGEYKDKPEGEDDPEFDAEYAATQPSPSIAPTKRIYQIAAEKGVGCLATSDDMVMLLSGIEEWVASTLGPLEQRVVALELAAEAAGGIVGSASEDRAVLQMLFDRVAGLEQSGGGDGGAFGTDDDFYTPVGTSASESATAALRMGVAPDLAKQVDTAALGRKISKVSSGAEGLDRRLKSVEKLLLGNATAAHPTPKTSTAVSGAGLLADKDDGDDDAHDAGPNRPEADDAAMSLVARLAVQEQRFGKMSAELEQQAKDIQKLKDDIATLAGGGGLPQHRPNPFGAGGPANFKITKPNRKPESGANVGGLEMPDMLSELKNATKRRAQKRREMGLTLLE